MEIGDGRDGLTGQVVHLAFELTGRLRNHMNEQAALLDLTPMQARALFMTSDPVPMRQLAQVLHCDASNITGIVDRLESRGLMSRVTDPKDRRKRNLVVTEEGREVTETLKGLLRNGNPVLVLQNEELERLHGLLTRVSEGGDPS